MREIKASLDCEEHQHVIEFTAKARLERTRQKEEHKSKQQEERKRRAKTAKQFKRYQIPTKYDSSMILCYYSRYRLDMQAQLQNMHQDEMVLRQKRVAAQKEERLAEV